MGLAKTAAAGTVKNVLELLRRIINYGVARNYIEPLKYKIKLPAVYNQVTEDLKPEQVAVLLKTLDEDLDQAAANLMRMALYTGMRRGEMLRLRWEDVDFERGFIRIVGPKGGKDQSIPLNASARAALNAQGLYSESPWVFPGRHKGKHAKEMRESISRICKAAKLPKGFRPLHGLRHVYASMLASSGAVDMYTLQKLLTHKSPLMTQRYAHLRDETLKRASGVVDDIMHGITTQAEATGDGHKEINGSK